MLSRIAESLFWAGRYVERAEDTARILDAHLHHLLEDPSVEEPTACHTLLSVMGCAGDGTPLEASAVTELLAFDDDNPGSIVSSLVAARSNARGIREVISSEMWEALNVTYNALGLQVQLGRQESSYEFFRFVRERAAMLAGLADSTMCRDDAWRFLALGRALERADMLVRLLSSEAANDWASVDWVTLLRSCSGHEAFLRTYRREPGAASTLEFLLRDRLFPRSILWSLSTTEQCLGELDVRPDRAGAQDEARRLIAAARSRLEYQRLSDLLRNLFEELVAVQRSVSATTESLANRYFHQATLIAWQVEHTEVPAQPDGAPRAPGQRREEVLP